MADNLEVESTGVESTEVGGSETGAKKTVITCEPTIDISSVQALLDTLRHAITNKHDVEINAGEVTRVDAAMLQMFTAFMLESKAHEQSVTWQSVSEVFYTSANLLGLAEKLKLPLRE